MKIAIIHYAEPVSRDKGFVLTRYASLARQLLENNIKVTRFFSSFNHRSRKYRNFGNYKDKYGHHIKINTPSYINSKGLKRLIFLRIFKKKIINELSKSKIKYDLFVIGCPMPGIASAVRKHFPEAKIVTDLRDFWPDVQISSATGIKKSIYKIFGYFFKKATINDLLSSNKIVTLSDTYAHKIKKICKLKFLPKVIPLGSISIKNNQRYLNSKNNKNGVLFVGSLNDLFDFDKLFKTWSLFEKKYPEIAKKNKLTIIGYGNYYNWIKKKSKKLKFIKITGHLPQKKVLNFMIKSKIAIILYKKNNFLTLPNKLFEFAAAGLPILSNWSGDALNNFTFNCKTDKINSIALKLKMILTNKSKLKSANFGALKFSRKFSQYQSSLEFKKIIYDLLK